MHTNHDESPDPIEPSATQPVREFAGVKLAPLTYTYRLAFFRLADGDASDVEAAKLLIFLLTKSPKEADAIRGETATAAFRLASDEWAAANMQGRIEEAIALYTAVWEEVARKEAAAKAA